MGELTVTELTVKTLTDMSVTYCSPKTSVAMKEQKVKWVPSVKYMSLLSSVSRPQMEANKGSMCLRSSNMTVWRIQH